MGRGAGAGGGAAGGGAACGAALQQHGPMGCGRHAPPVPVYSHSSHSSHAVRRAHSMRKQTRFAPPEPPPKRITRTRGARCPAGGGLSRQ